MSKICKIFQISDVLRNYDHFEHLIESFIKSIKMINLFEIFTNF